MWSITALLPLAGLTLSIFSSPAQAQNSCVSEAKREFAFPATNRGVASNPVFRKVSPEGRYIIFTSELGDRTKGLSNLRYVQFMADTVSGEMKELPNFAYFSGFSEDSRLLLGSRLFTRNIGSPESPIMVMDADRGKQIFVYDHKADKQLLSVQIPYAEEAESMLLLSDGKTVIHENDPMGKFVAIDLEKKQVRPLNAAERALVERDRPKALKAEREEDDYYKQFVNRVIITKKDSVTQRTRLVANFDLAQSLPYPRFSLSADGKFLIESSRRREEKHEAKIGLVSTHEVLHRRVHSLETKEIVSEHRDNFTHPHLSGLVEDERYFFTVTENELIVRDQVTAKEISRIDLPTATFGREPDRFAGDNLYLWRAERNRKEFTLLLDVRAGRILANLPGEWHPYRGAKAISFDAVKQELKVRDLLSPTCPQAPGLEDTIPPPLGSDIAS